MFKSTQSRIILLVSAFFLLLTGITLWVVMRLVAPSLLKTEYQRVHAQIGEQATAITTQMSRVQAQQGSLTETVSLLESAQIDNLLPALINQNGDSALFGGGVWPLPGMREAGIDRHSTFFARDRENRLRLNSTWNDASAPPYWEQSWFKAGSRAAKASAPGLKPISTRPARSRGPTARCPSIATASCGAWQPLT